ncbi:DUF1996 domain-containing protein [Actinomycetospora sp.]|jgi:hypothetical protein|uniref:DUF1996 domain-containing protein n=1 Tax=Actinomycetospora sp. TaxID=1872135 RepID=UPI002F40C3AB
MPRRGRHRTRLPFRLIAAVAALLVGGTAVVLGGTALAKGSHGGNAISSLAGKSSSDGSSSSDKGDGSKDSGDSGDSKDSSDGGKDSGSGSKDSSSGGSGDKGSSDSGSSDSSGKDGKNDQGNQDGQNKDKKNNNNENNNNDKKNNDNNNNNDKNNKNNKNDEFAGRDKIAPAGGDDFVDINNVAPNGNIGNGGVFSGGSSAVDCGVSDHNNSDNFIAAPGKRNGAQHVHDYVGNNSTNANSDDGSLNAAGTSCANGDKSTFYWPVLRDLNGQGPDVGQDGGSKDGNVGSILKPTSVQISFHGHGDEKVTALPTNLKIITGNAKAKVQDGKNANAKYTCTGFTDRVTSKYPICPAGSHLQRIIDFPSCWDGQNLDSKDHISHTAFPDEKGNCQDGFTAIPALHEVLTYDQPAGKAFSIDSFPDNQHDPITDHGDFQSVETPEQAKAAADCINSNKNCTNVAG